MILFNDYTYCVFVAIVWEVRKVSVVKQCPAYSHNNVIIWLLVPLCTSAVSITWITKTLFSVLVTMQHIFQISIFSNSSERCVMVVCITPLRKGRYMFSHTHRLMHAFIVYTHTVFTSMHTHTTIACTQSLIVSFFAVLKMCKNVTMAICCNQTSYFKLDSFKWWVGLNTVFCWKGSVAACVHRNSVPVTGNSCYSDISLLQKYKCALQI